MEESIALIEAAEKNHLAIVKLLLKHFNFKPHSDEYYLAEISAVSNGHFEVAKFLFDSYRSTSTKEKAQRDLRLMQLLNCAIFGSSNLKIVKLLYPNKTDNVFFRENLNRKIKHYRTHDLKKFDDVEFIACLLFVGCKITDLFENQIDNQEEKSQNLILQASHRPIAWDIFETLYNNATEEFRSQVQDYFVCLATAEFLQLTILADWLLRTEKVQVAAPHTGGTTILEAIAHSSTVPKRIQLTERFLERYGATFDDCESIGRNYISENENPPTDPNELKAEEVKIAQVKDRFKKLQSNFYWQQFLILERRRKVKSKFLSLKKDLIKRLGDETCQDISHEVFEFCDCYNKYSAKEYILRESNKLIHIVTNLTSRLTRELAEQEKLLDTLRHTFKDKPEIDLYNILVKKVSELKPRNLVTIRAAVLEFKSQYRKQIDSLPKFKAVVAEKEKAIDRLIPNFNEHYEAELDLSHKLYHKILFLNPRNPITIRETVLKFRYQYRNELPSFFLLNNVVSRLIKQTKEYSTERSLKGYRIDMEKNELGELTYWAFIEEFATKFSDEEMSASHDSVLPSLMPDAKMEVSANSSYNRKVNLPVLDEKSSAAIKEPQPTTNHSTFATEVGQTHKSLFNSMEGCGIWNLNALNAPICFFKSVEHREQVKTLLENTFKKLTFTKGDLVSTQSDAVYSLTAAPKKS